LSIQKDRSAGKPHVDVADLLRKGRGEIGKQVCVSQAPSISSFARNHENTGMKCMFNLSQEERIHHEAIGALCY
jgi:hypothetical protein